MNRFFSTITILLVVFFMQAPAVASPNLGVVGDFLELVRTGDFEKAYSLEAKFLKEKGSPNIIRSVFNQQGAKNELVKNLRLMRVLKVNKKVQHLLFIFEGNLSGEKGDRYRVEINADMKKTQVFGFTVKKGMKKGVKK